MNNNVITWFQNVSLLFNYKGKVVTLQQQDFRKPRINHMFKFNPLMFRQANMM